MKKRSFTSNPCSHVHLINDNETVNAIGYYLAGRKTWTRFATRSTDSIY